MAENFRTQKELVLSRTLSCNLVKWKVSVNQKVSKGSILAVYKTITEEIPDENEIVVLPKLKSNVGGSVERFLVTEGQRVDPGQAVILLNVCEHKTVMKEMCAECGADLRQEPGIPGHLKEPVSASVALVHNIPELRVSQKEAEILARKDKEMLLKNEKLVLLVDLDQTLIHTTTENVPPDMKDVYHFQLHGQNCWYHTKFRPGWRKFLEDMSKFYELHIFTMGSRMYAHTIARMLDPDGVLFAERIRSRDESFDMCSKYRDLRALFPCDDSMVCIIDDREDIWDRAPNLVTVKPYRFFSGTGDINAPPGSIQAFTHAPAIPLHENAVERKDTTDGGGQLENHKDVEGDSDGINVDNEGTNKGKDEDHEGTDENQDGVAGQEGTNEDEDGCGRVLESDLMKSEDTSKDEICSTKSATEGNSEISEKAATDGKEPKHDNEWTETEETSEEKQESSGDLKEQVNAMNETEDNIVLLKDESGDSQTKSEDVVDGNHRVEDHDDYLLYLEEILRRIHDGFYKVLRLNKQSQENIAAPDLRQIVPELRRNVLKGTKVVFTGVIPTNTRHEDSQAWKIAQQFGASVCKDLLTHKNTPDKNQCTTHVIAARPGTEKACQALRLPSVHLVNPNWLWTCAERWEWVDERLFPLEDYQEYKARKNDTPTSSKRNTPKGENEGFGLKKSKVCLTEEESLDHITEDNLRIVMNPFLSFSSGEMAAMDKEVEDLMRSSDEEDDEQILGSISSSSNSENGILRRIQEDEDSVDGNANNFSTIKESKNRQIGEGSRPSKRRKLDFVDENEAEFSSDSSGSNSSDDNDMAAMLEAELCEREFQS